MSIKCVMGCNKIEGFVYLCDRCLFRRYDLLYNEKCVMYMFCKFLKEILKKIEIF